MNMNLDILETVKSAFGSVEIFLQSTDGKYDLELMNRTVDLCRLFRDITYEPMLQVGMRLSKSSSNYLTGCFMKKVISLNVFSCSNALRNFFIQ